MGDFSHKKAQMMTISARCGVLLGKLQKNLISYINRWMKARTHSRHES